MQRANKRAIWGWYAFDWAAQPYHTLLVTFIFAPYFASAVVSDPVEGQALWGFMMGAVGICVLVLAPIFGAVADSSGPRKPWILFFVAMTAVGASALWWAEPGADAVWPILVAFALGLVSVELAQTFINAVLPTLGPRRDLGVIGGNAWALGYAGGVASLIVMLLLFAEGAGGKTLLGNAPALGLDPEAREGTRLVGPLTAAWLLAFALPYLIFTPDVERFARTTGAVRRGMRELFQTIRYLPETPSFFAYLGSSMFYRDALGGLYAFGGIYAVGVLEWEVTQVGIFGIIAAAAGALACWVGGYADRAFGPKRVIFWCILVLIAVCVTVVGMSRESFFGMPLAPGSALPDQVFFVCGAVIGAMGGVLQSASRTLLVDQANPDRVTEAFGLYALAGRATSFLAPTLIALATTLTDSQRLGVSPVIGLFVLGLVILYFVKSRKEYA